MEMLGPTPNPMLRMIHGPSTVRLYPLIGRRTLIGRLPGCDIVLTPQTISKMHAEIVMERNHYLLINYSKKAGVVVNGRRIDAPVVLSNGMSFQIAAFEFQFQSGLESIIDGDSRSTVFATSSIALGTNRNIEETLRVVLEISRELGRALRMDEVLDRTLNSLFRLYPQAERGQVFLKSGEGEPMLPRAIQTRLGRESVPAISRTILERVMLTRQAVLCGDASVEFPDSHSVYGHNLRSLMCAPLLDSSQKAIGVIQIDAAYGRGLFQEADLDVLAAVASQVGLAAENARLHEIALREADHESELRWARRIMMSLLPERRCDPVGYESWSFYQAARKVGGDYLGGFPFPEPDGTTRRWAIAVGDVVGKGLPAAIFLARLSAEVRAVVTADSDPAEILLLLNDSLMGVGVEGMFVTFLVAFLDADTHQLTFASAGHPVPRIYRAKTGKVEAIGEKSNGFPLAVENDVDYQTVSLTIQPGDLAVFFTDGTYEALNASGQCLTLAEMERVIAGSTGRAEDVGKALISAINRHSANHPQSDDIALLCLGRPA